MISSEHLQLMARYNQWQNRSLYGAAETLSEAQRREDRGAFFGSIQRTLSHLLWADTVWMHRLAGTPGTDVSLKESPNFREAWATLAKERPVMDQTLIDWAAKVPQEWLRGTTTWFSGALGREISRPNWILATHIFNHQTHHRGQVHAMLTSFGAKPEDTDIPFMPEG